MLGSWLHRRSEWFLHAATAIGFGGRRALAGWIMYGLRCPVSWLPPLAGFGPFTHRDEYASILDNFFEGALRFEPLERHVSSTTNALVLDVGVNVGITVRWWLHLNPHAQVIAVDMIREANEFSARALAAVNPAYPAQVRYVEAVVGETSGSMEISFDDPLAGTNSTRARNGATRREVATRTLDDIWLEAGGRDVAVLKIDIEGAAGATLAGAPQVLRRSQFVVAEWHDAAELSRVTSLCLDAGLSLVSVNAKMLFFERILAEPRS